MSFLDHENVMKIRNKFEDEQHIYFIMDLMVDDLRNLFNSIGDPMNECFTKKIFHDMLKAVSYCHQQKVIHRDIKMENFLLDYDGTAGEVQIKLTDFGLAAMNFHKNSLRHRVGTLICMAPEIIQGESFTEKSDCWSLGVILYELLTYQMPFQDEN